MINVTRLNDKEYVINADLVESIEANPDTTITMTTGKKIIVKESIDEVIDRVIAFKRKIYKSDFS